ncbi:hypothetical protein [Rhizobium johnstonii]|uniref:hypothetical protein n=1 Tax=Rhizobium johnstonii TaxID=3019933 RepID=UPI003F9D755E
MAVITADLDSEATKILKSPGFWSGVVRRLCRDPVALAALGVVILLVLIAIFAPYIAP